METYKINLDNDDKNIKLNLNGIYKKVVEKTKESFQSTKLNSNFDNSIYQESIVGNKVSKIKNNNTRISNMIGNKAISFSTIVD